MDNFRHRKDSQIMGLEMLAIGLGVSSFAHLISKRRVVIWSDNTGAETAVKSGKAKAFDHTCLAHCLWVQLIKLKTEVFIQRVPTEVNIADLPSREEYSLLESIGAEWVQPRLDQLLCRPDSWESLSLSHQGIGRSSDRESAK